MKKLKITNSQKNMLESSTNAKMVKEMDIRPSQSPSMKVSKEFKKQTSGISGIKTEQTVDNMVPWTELVPHVHELIKQMYVKPSKEEMNPYWETVGISWDEIIDLLSKLELIKSVKGGYRLSKVVESPAKAVRIVAKLIEKMITDKHTPAVEETSHDDIAQNFKQQVAPENKNKKSRAELLKIIADKRAEEMKRREAEKNRPIGEDNYPMGAKNNPDAPWNQVDPEPKTVANNKVMDVLWYDSEFALMKGEGKLWLYNIDSADTDEYADYAAREETYLGNDEDGFPDIEYGEFDIDDDVIRNYVNDNLKHLSRGRGLSDYEDDNHELVEVDYELAQDLLPITKYIVKRDPKKAEIFQNILSSISMEETTTAASSGAFVGSMGGGNGPIHKSNVKDEVDGMISEMGESPITKLMSMFNDDVRPDQWLSYSKELLPLVQDLNRNKEYTGIITNVVKMLQIADMMNSMPNIANKIAGQFVLAKKDLKMELNALAQASVEEATTTTSAGGDSGTFAYDAPVGDGSDFWHAGNKMAKKGKGQEGTVNEIKGRQNKNAQTDTQWPDGHFVEFDKCTKYNNNKDAQNGGCSTGAVDNVVKTKSSKNSVISDATIYEEVAEMTGRSIDEVKSIIDNKITKSK